MSKQINIPKTNFTRGVYRKIIALTTKISPKIASNILYSVSFGERLNLKKPRYFDEKLMWLKLNEDDTKKVIGADKYRVRDYVKKKGLGSILNELYFVYDRTEDIDFDVLPESFVLKCTHGNGCHIICKNKKNLDEKSAINSLEKWMGTNYSFKSAEMHYGKIKPRIIAEKYLETSNNQSLVDYKIHCFHGKPRIIEVIVDRFTDNPQFLFLDLDWNLLPYNKYSIHYDKEIEKPQEIEEMLKISEDLSKDFTYVRVDLYYHKEKIYFGELTFTPAGCRHTHLFEKAQNEMGLLIDLNKEKKTKLSNNKLD